VTGSADGSEVADGVGAAVADNSIVVVDGVFEVVLESVAAVTECAIAGVDSSPNVCGATIWGTSAGVAGSVA